MINNKLYLYYIYYSYIPKHSRKLWINKYQYVAEIVTWHHCHSQTSSRWCSI